jgi:hypothetical protein
MAGMGCVDQCRDGCRNSTGYLNITYRKAEKAFDGSGWTNVSGDFPGRCLPFDYEAAVEYALIVSERNRKGHPISVEDAQIAAIANTAGLVLATRNTKDFSDITGLKLVDPWADS